MSTGSVVVALPAAEDQVHAIGPEQKHATLAFLGEISDADAEMVNLALAGFSWALAPATGAVKALEPLGEDDPQAQVLLLDSEELAHFRELLLAQPKILELFSAIEQYPNFTPHVTLGYGDEVTAEHRQAAEALTEIRFDRLAVWHADEQTEYPLGADMTATEAEQPTMMSETTVPWYGVLAPEGKPSGDGRMFAADSLSMRDLPLPLTWQKTTASGHDGSVTVARIDNIWREDGLMKAEGVFLNTPEATEVMSLLTEFGRYGVSVDADSAVFEYGEDETVVFTSARIASASIVSIPAFAEAWVSLGTWADVQPTEDAVAAEFIADLTTRDVPTDERKDLADEGKAMPDGSFPIANCEDLANAIQAIGRAKDPAAAKAHIKKRASSLTCPDVSIPETWSTIANPTFVVTEDGPGWLTHPVDTDRLRDYWTHGEGAAKINWGVPGDFNRCRAELAKYVKPEYLAGYCANRHYDALGFWPGRPTSGDTTAFAPALSLVAAAPRKDLPADWFADPDLDGPTSLTVTPEGRVYAHLATWGTCHIGFDGVCVEPPASMANYAYFRTGQVQTDAGPVATGSISMGGGHAGANLGYRPAMAHYDSTSSVVADVACGEDAHGIWIAGAIREGVTEQDVATLVAAGGLSGDWRRIAGNLELVAALAVNVPGFPVPRLQVASSNGNQMALIAAGIVGPDKDDPIKELADEVERLLSERTEARARREELRKKTHGERIDALRSRLEGKEN